MWITVKNQSSFAIPSLSFCAGHAASKSKRGRSGGEPSSSSRPTCPPDAEDTQVSSEAMMEQIAEEFLAANGSLNLDAIEKVESKPAPVVH